MSIFDDAVSANTKAITDAMNDPEFQETSGEACKAFLKIMEGILEDGDQTAPTVLAGAGAAVLMFALKHRQENAGEAEVLAKILTMMTIYGAQLVD